MVNLIRAVALTNYAEIARQFSLDPVLLLRRHGMSHKLIADPERRIPIRPVMALLEESARLADCPSFGLRMAESRQLSDIGPLSLLLTHQSTLGDALRTLVEYREFLNPSYALDIEQVGNAVLVHSRLMGGGVLYSPQSEELAMGVLARMCNALLGARWHPRRVQFTHNAPPDPGVHRRVFGCAVEFGREFNALVLRGTDLEQPNSSADAGMARFARRYVDSLRGASKDHSVVLEARKAIYLMLPAGRATIEQVAYGMGVNVRTLQRRLDDAGVTFSGLLDEVRSELVLRYLENPDLSLARIAGMLGYGMPSSFTRWFNVQFGMAHLVWRLALTREG